MQDQPLEGLATPRRHQQAECRPPGGKGFLDRATAGDELLAGSELDRFGHGGSERRAAPDRAAQSEIGIGALSEIRVGPRAAIRRPRRPGAAGERGALLRPWTGSRSRPLERLTDRRAP